MAIEVQRIEDLFSQDGGIPKDLLRNKIIEDIKEKHFIGIPESYLEVELEPADGSDILITKLIDPKKALGYRVFDDLEDYYNNLSAELYVPQASDFGQGGE